MIVFNSDYISDGLEVNVRVLFASMAVLQWIYCYGAQNEKKRNKRAETICP